MNSTIPSASAPARPRLISRTHWIAIRPSAKKNVPKPASAVRTSGPKIRLRTWAISSASPKVASSEVNMSRSTTRRMTAR